MSKLINKQTLHKEMAEFNQHYRDMNGYEYQLSQLEQCLSMLNDKIDDLIDANNKQEEDNIQRATL